MVRGKGKMANHTLLPWEAEPFCGEERQKLVMSFIARFHETILSCVFIDGGTRTSMGVMLGGKHH